MRVAEAWKIGRKKIDDGVLLVVAKNDRRLRIEVGYGLEGALTDVTARRIIDEIITPKFRTGDFAGGISAGVDRIIAGDRRRELPAPEPQHWQAPRRSIESIRSDPFAHRSCCLPSARSCATCSARLLGSAATGGVVGAGGLVHLGSLSRLAVVGDLHGFHDGAGCRAVGGGRPGSGGRVAAGVAGPRRRSWSGGSSSSGSGGFSGGGGGSFGGGGASGSW